MVLNYESDKQDDAVSDETVDELIRDFQCKVFEIKNYSKKDIENIFFYLNQRIAERISCNKPKKGDWKQKLKVNRKRRVKVDIII